MGAALAVDDLPQPFFDVFFVHSEQVGEFKRASVEIATNLAETVTWTADVTCERAQRAIDAALSLQQGWDSYHAAPPSPEAAKWARKIIEIVRTDFFAEPRVIASAAGGITAAFVCDERFAQVEVLNSGAIMTTAFSRTIPPQVEEFPSDEQSLSSAIETLRNFLRG